MNLDTQKPEIQSTTSIIPPKTQSIGTYIQTEKQKNSESNLIGQPPKDIFIRNTQTESPQKASVVQPLSIETAKKEPLKVKADEEKKLIQELRKKAQKGKLKPLTEEEVNTVMAMPLNDGLKNDLRDLVKKTEIGNDTKKYNEDVLKILNKHELT
jgi:hypothetical protein